MLSWPDPHTPQAADPILIPAGVNDPVYTFANAEAGAVAATGGNGLTLHGASLSIAPLMDDGLTPTCNSRPQGKSRVASPENQRKDTRMNVIGSILACIRFSASALRRVVRLN